MKDNRKIGIIDSGVGGLTVAKEFRRLLPKENVIYLGDNKNVPYGNKKEEEIYYLTKKMIDFLIQRDVKLIAVACNTISSILDRHFLDYTIPIVSIIKPVTDYVDKKRLKSVGVMATKFTIESKTYEKLLNEKDKSLTVVSESCPTLATIIDRGDYESKEIMETINIHMDNILRKTAVKDIILGCTHYPIVLEKFKKISPNINFINPAYEQTLYVDNIIKKLGISGSETNSTFEIFTTGKTGTYLDMIDSLSMKSADRIYEIKEF
ncbi:glutamate racemase [Tissierella creatinophila]|uniref:Glutamate racemase n=1 Tax=Tissierella creatinophila DSM 6911 TaxID=1123403 RepID=A0A1U7M8U1_TISCR|nr:glutamate racemase [Tissierella creatinophila]OLS03717.1 glutamate racemase [Tissierella creatinophila DSM 6911]